MSKKLKIPKRTVGYEYTGVWKDGSVGWMGASHIGSSRKYPGCPSMAGSRGRLLQGERLFLCKIIAVPVRDKRGRPITKIVK